MVQKSCLACKELIPAEDRYCMHCGVEQVAKPEVVVAPEAAVVVEPVAAPAAEVVAAVPEVKVQQQAASKPLGVISTEIGVVKEFLASDLVPSLPVDTAEPKTLAFEQQSDCSDLELVPTGKSEVIKSSLSVEAPILEKEFNDGGEFNHNNEKNIFSHELNGILPDDSKEKINQLGIPKYLRRDTENDQINIDFINCKACATKLPVYSRFCLICGISQAEDLLAPKKEQALLGLPDVVEPVQEVPLKDSFGKLNLPQSEVAGLRPSISPDDVKWRKSMAEIRLRQERARQDLVKLLGDKDWWRNG